MSFVITTPLYYVNDKPHLGSIYTTLICDSIARYKRLTGADVIFITGVDEHGLKIQRTAKNKGVEPQFHCDEISDIFKQNWKDWDITHNKFVRTSSKKHEYIVKEFYNRVKNQMIFTWESKKVGIALVVKNLKIIQIIHQHINVLFIKKIWNGKMRKIFFLSCQNTNHK